MTQIELEDYQVHSKIFFGNNYLFIFQNQYDISERRVLEMKDVVGFIENADSHPLISLRIIEGGTYPFDLSARCNRPEVVNFPEVLISTANTKGMFYFRACAASIIFREWTIADAWLR
ncbi:hypothetical protein [Chitinophaga rhizophila]|uniref:Uncharacterized protein n=1 Tax=Chitinophaga rhizophila TaxID=2866212 RepID=A0ABS7GAQ7_9BACT|nr:hypothetical protein [Chitinophaga rhizophila]MBW8684360.1 hypothetical protein [Chitinophaga rhizophila]